MSLRHSVVSTFKETAFLLTAVAMGVSLGAANGALTRLAMHQNVVLGSLEGATAGGAAAATAYVIENGIVGFLHRRATTRTKPPIVGMVASVSTGTFIGAGAALCLMFHLPYDTGAMVLGGAASSGAVSAGVFASLRPRRNSQELPPTDLALD